MTIRRMIPLADFPAAADAVLAALERDGAAIFPTETVYGIGVAHGSPRALGLLRRLKGREAGKPFQLLIPDLAAAEAMGAEIPPAARLLAERYWPGPLTLVLRRAGGDDWLGLRVPDSALLREVCRRLGRAVAASSANPAGAPPPLEAGDADRFGDEVEVAVDGGRCRVGVPSSVVRVRADGWDLLREGAVSGAEIEALCGPSGPFRRGAS